MLNDYWQQAQTLLFQDQAHAWSLLSFLYLIATLSLKCILISPVKKASKRISSKNLKSLQSKYLTRSLFGWFFYAVSLGLFILAWYAHYFQAFGLKDKTCCLGAASGGVFLLSIIFLLSAYTTSSLDQIKQLEDQQLTP